jgi:hypothetical protein
LPLQHFKSSLVTLRQPQGGSAPPLGDALGFEGKNVAKWAGLGQGISGSYLFDFRQPLAMASCSVQNQRSPYSGLILVLS